MMLEENKDKIHKAFISYVSHATEVLKGRSADQGMTFQRPPLKEKMVVGSPKLAYIHAGFRLRYLAEVAENSPQFTELCFEGGDERQRTLRSFFRRSRFYTSAFNGEQPSADLFEVFWLGLLKRRVKITTMRILVGVEFASRVVDFGAFKIQKFSQDELDTLTGKEVNDVFYDFARVDTNILSRYWMLVEERAQEDYSNRDMNNVATESDFDALIDEASAVKLETPDRPIQLLAIHDWTPDYTEKELKEMQANIEMIKRAWHGITVPNRFEFSDDLFNEPGYLEELRVGSPDPFDEDFSIAIGKDQEAEIRKIVEKGSKLFEVVERAKPNWDFVPVAVGYCSKAFLTQRSPEQLLWNVAVLDSLLSEKGEVTQSIKRRIGNILGATEQEKKNIRREFDELYDFRSDLVHGNTRPKRVRDDHLFKARQLASRTMAWFIDYLLWVDEDFRQREIGYEHYPRREELLYVLDFDRASLNRLNRFIGRLPTSFPRF